MPYASPCTPVRGMSRKVADPAIWDSTSRTSHSLKFWRSESRLSHCRRCFNATSCLYYQSLAAAFKFQCALQLHQCRIPRSHGILRRRYPEFLAASRRSVWSPATRVAVQREGETPSPFSMINLKKAMPSLRLLPFSQQKAETKLWHDVLKRVQVPTIWRFRLPNPDQTSHGF